MRVRERLWKLVVKSSFGRGGPVLAAGEGRGGEQEIRWECVECVIVAHAADVKWCTGECERLVPRVWPLRTSGCVGWIKGDIIHALRLDWCMESGFRASRRE